MKKKHFIILALLLPLSAFCQEEKFSIKKGNEAYKEGMYDDAARNYEKAIDIKGDSRAALFNYGNAWQRKARTMQEKAMQQENDSLKMSALTEAMAMSKKAAEAYETVAKSSETKEEKNKSNYNLGNARLMGGEVDKAIEAYKESLRNKPEDEDARYNLAYAQWLKKQQQEKPEEQQQEEQEQNKDQQDQEQKKDEQNQQQEQQKPNELSKEDAEKMLDAMMNQEKDLMNKVSKDRHKAQRIKIEKDW